MNRYLIEHIPAQAERYLIIDFDLEIIIGDCDTKEEAEVFKLEREEMDKVKV